MKNLNWATTVQATNNSDFAEARQYLCRRMFRQLFSFKGAGVFFRAPLLSNGACVLASGLLLQNFLQHTALDAVWHNVFFGVYLAWMGLYIYASHGPDVIAETPYFSKYWLNNVFFYTHVFVLFTMFFLNMPWYIIVGVEVVMLLLWLGLLAMVFLFGQRAFSLVSLVQGRVVFCSQRDMVLEVLQATVWWKQLATDEKLTLWQLLPTWKWDMYAHVVELQEPELLARLDHWMQLETDPYWAMTLGIHGDDTTARIRTYLQAATRGQTTIDSYPLPV